ncbi:MAG: CCA tRNA nucleotidyltransferase [Gemmatimonadaceae bacterium]
MPLLNPPQPVLEIARRLEDAGYEAWCVGGALRDAILGHPHLDWDLATSATPDQVREIFGKRRTIPVGIQFGTVGVLDAAGTLHEVTTFRRDVKTDGRHAEVEFGASLEEDLARRDFTINAIAYSPARDELRDPFHGRDDLARRVVRAVGDADARMREDRLRALRAIRFAARFEFEIEQSTLDAITRSAPHMNRLSPERVKQELEKTMEQVRRPSRALGLWKSTGVLATVIPELATISDTTIDALDCLAMPGTPGKSYRLLLRLALPFVELGEERARAALTALRFSNVEIRRIADLARAWTQIRPSILESVSTTPSVPDAVIRRWVAAIGRLDIGPFMRLVTAVAKKGHGAAFVGARLHALYRRMARVALRDPIAIADLAIDGDDMRIAGIPAGPWVGKILKALLDVVLTDPARNDRDWLLQEARRLYTP